MNPVRKKLCVNAQDYPFSGSFSDFGAEMFRAVASIEPWTPPWRKNRGSKGTLEHRN
jgi:hypothetical protein